MSDCRSRGPELDIWSHTFVEIGHKIISTVFSSLRLNQRLLSVISESMHTKY